MWEWRGMQKGMKMKRIAMLILLTAAVAFGQQAAEPASKAKILTRAEFDQLMATPGRVLLLDVASRRKLRKTAVFRCT